MNYGTYYPEQRHVLSLTTIRRERLLPTDAIGEIETREGDRVDIREVIARGSVPSRYMILEASEALRLKRPDDLLSAVLVEENDVVEAGQVIAGKATGRGRKVVAPVTGIVVYIGEGRIIIQETPEPIELEAGLVGQVVAVRQNRGVVIETVGAVLQGVWGNGRTRVGVLRMEPEEGIENIYSDQLDVQYRNAVVVTRRALKPITLQVIEDQGFAGVIAPSMEPSMIEAVTRLNAAIVLTMGFGDLRMPQFISNFLEQLQGKQAAVDATLPDRFEARRPEVIVNQPVRSGQRPPTPDENLLLRNGVNVRLTRGQFAGATGQIINLLKTPYLLDNGLRVQCAQVQLTTGETPYVPVANLEVFGQ